MGDMSGYSEYAERDLADITAIKAILYIERICTSTIGNHIVRKS